LRGFERLAQKLIVETLSPLLPAVPVVPAGLPAAPPIAAVDAALAVVPLVIIGCVPL
jgi:hypothetical protein